MNIEQLFEEVLKEGSYAQTALSKHSPWDIGREEFNDLEKLCNQYLKLKKIGRFSNNSPTDYSNLKSAVTAMISFLEEIDN